MTDTVVSESAAARIAFLRGLRAVRQLRPDPLPEPVLNDILEVARWSGSAGNRQPWDFVVVRDRDTLRRLATIDSANAGHLATAAAGIAVVIRPEVPDLAVKRYSGRPAPQREWPARWMALGATLAGWDRSALERPDPTQSAVRAS